MKRTKQTVQITDQFGTHSNPIEVERIEMPRDQKSLAELVECVPSSQFLRNSSHIFFEIQVDNMAKDFVGTEINVGDTVVFTELRYRCLNKGTIISITPKMVNIQPLMHKSYMSNLNYTPGVRQTHDQVIVIDSVKFGSIINAPIE